MSTKQPRNLLFLLADQLRHDAPGYAGGRAATPNLDRLAARGTAFSRAYTPLPVCGPARQALLCGWHPDSMGTFWNAGFLPIPPFRPQATFPQLLKESGRTGTYLGKWDIYPGTEPADFGFDSHLDKGAYEAYRRERYPDIAFPGGWMGCENPIPLEDSDTHFWARAACDAIRSANHDFFLWVDFGVPHLPCRPSKPFSEMYDPKDIPKWPGYDDSFAGKPYCHKQQSFNWRLEDTPWEKMAPQVARYWGMVSQLDDAVGRILEALEETGHREDTLVVVTSDHGDMCGNHRMLDKHYVLYDDVVRVPLLVAGPGIGAGVNHSLVSNCLDLPVTICKRMGLPPLPGAHGLPLPFGGGNGRKAIISSSNGQQFGMFNCRMITDGRYKYVWNLTDIDELYDLEADPGECRNLIREPAQADRIASMAKALYHELAAHGDPFANDWLAPQLLEGRKHSERTLV